MNSQIVSITVIFINNLIIHGSGKCLTDVALRQDKCYFIPKMSTMTRHHNWTDSRMMCNAENADLLSIEDEMTIYDVHIMFSSVLIDVHTIWTGLRFIEKTRHFEWSDESEYKKPESFWNIGQPNNLISKNRPDGQDCIIIKRTGYVGWNDNACSKRLVTICQLNNASETLCPTTEGWIYISERCFYLNDSTQTWIDAVHYCKNINTDTVMMMPKTEVDMNVVLHLMQSNKIIKVWIGLSDRDEEGVYRWLDGSILLSPYMFVPDTMSIGYSCMAINSSRNWQFMPCDHEYTVVCQRSKSTVAVTTSMPQTTSSNSSITLVSTQNTTLASANYLCKECVCDKITYTNKTLNDELALKVAELKKILTVNKEDLSSTKRKKTSASDDRISSQSMGFVAASIICIVCVCVVILDLLPRGH